MKVTFGNTTAIPPSTSATSASTTTPQEIEEETVPKDALVIDKILKSMGVTEYEPRVVEQLLELIHRYTSNILLESQIYMQHANRTKLDIDDVKLATQSRVSYSFSEPPSVDFLLEQASQKNKQSFTLPPNPAVFLPPEHHCLSSKNYQVETKRRKTTQ